MVNKKLRFITRLIMCSLVVLVAVGVGESAKAVNNTPKMLTAWDNGSGTLENEKAEAELSGAAEKSDKPDAAEAADTSDKPDAAKAADTSDKPGAADATDKDDTAEAADKSDTTEAASTGIQMRAGTRYAFYLTTHGEWEEDMDVTSMRRKYRDTLIHVKGINGGPDPIIIWAVGQYSEGYHDLIDCVDCSAGHTYYLTPVAEFWVENVVYQRKCTYVALAGMMTTEELNCIAGEMTPDI